MTAELQQYVRGCISLEPLADRVVRVLAALPGEVLQELRDDEGFHLAMEDYQPGRGTKVWMPVATGNWQASRTVVLRPRLNDCREDFALYVIAHELAHAYLRNGGWGEIQDPELAADGLAAHWGFSRPSDWWGAWQIWRG
jgi:hypothetical protein